MKFSPFYKDVYYKGKISYSYRRHMPRWKWIKYKPIIRTGPFWLRDFMVYPNYAMLMRRVNEKMRPKK